jgi:tryptophan 2,3-dioxygenase
MSQKYATVHYQDYLELEKLLGSQSLRSEKVGAPAHEEMLFIIVHQVYELWFKQIIHELHSIISMFDEDQIDERSISVAITRLDRIIEIQKLLIQQIRVMETMTPLDFLDFRNYLFPASGFQSFQFRLIETMLGLENEARMTYNNIAYDSVFPEKQREILRGIESGKTILRVVEAWLERTPFLDLGDFNFLENYQKSVAAMLEKEKSAILMSDYLNETEKEMRLKMLGSTDSYFQSVFDETEHNKLKDTGKLKLSYKATIAALLITLYHDEPILQMPFSLLKRLTEIDENWTTWRYRHAQMVRRMLGQKIGTGGSSGFDYLAATASKHQIFIDFHNLSTLLIPRSELHALPEVFRKELGFYFSTKSPPTPEGR